MARVIPDLIDGDVSLSINGNSVRRLFQVQELTGAASGRLVSAASASGVPRVGDAHPSLGGVRVTDVRASAASDPTVATVEVTYGIAQGTTTGVNTSAIEVSIVSDLYSEETIKDVNGRTITTRYFSSTASNGSFSSTLATQVHRIEVQRPTFTVQYSRIESRPAFASARAYSGRVNGGQFLGEPADRWLCNIESYQDNQSAHRVRYSFTLNETGWQATIAHQTNGIIPAPVGTQNGIENVQVYNRANFSALRLPSL